MNSEYTVTKTFPESEWDIIEVRSQMFDWDGGFGLSIKLRNGLRHAVACRMPIPTQDFASVMSKMGRVLQEWIDMKKENSNA